MNGLILIVGKVFQFSNGFFLELWRFVCRGKKIDIKCDCCEHNDLIPNDFESIKKEKCFGKKSAYIIEKVVDEIVLAKARRESDGTYSA